MFYKLYGREEETKVAYPGEDKLHTFEGYSNNVCNEYQADAAPTAPDIDEWSPPIGLDSDDADVDGEEKPDMSVLNPPPGIKPNARHPAPAVSPMSTRDIMQAGQDIAPLTAPSYPAAGVTKLPTLHRPLP